MEVTRRRKLRTLRANERFAEIDLETGPVIG